MAQHQITTHIHINFIPVSNVTSFYTRNISFNVKPILNNYMGESEKVLNVRVYQGPKVCMCSQFLVQQAETRNAIKSAVRTLSLSLDINWMLSVSFSQCFGSKWRRRCCYQTIMWEVIEQAKLRRFYLSEANSKHRKKTMNTRLDNNTK